MGGTDYEALGWHKADRKTCPNCGRQTFVCARCGERKHSGGLGSAVRTPDDDSPLRLDFVACDPCAKVLQSLVDSVKP